MLSLAGEWIVGAGHELEAAGASLLSLGQRRETRDPRSRRSSAHGHGRRVVHRSRPRSNWRPPELRSPTAASSPSTTLLLKEAGYHPPEKSTRVPPPHRVALLSAVGETVYDSGVDFFDIVDYLGEIVVMFLRLAPQPWRWRWTSMVHHLEMYGLRSVPIIMLINFLVGAIVTQQGIFQLTSFGASDLRRQSGWRPGFARTWRADDLDHDRRTHRIGDHRRDRLDEDARGDRRSEGDGARSAGSADHPAAGGAGHRSAGPDLPCRPGADRGRPHRQLALRRLDAGRRF